MMVPMRRALIVKEHGQLPYPEGTACAEVLIAGERGGEMAKTVFAGFWTAFFYALANKLFALWREVPRLIATGPAGAYKNATLTSEITPEYLGVGYIIGPRISGIMVSGSVLSWLALIPLLSMLVPEETIKADLLKLGFTQGWMDANSHANWIYRAYVRYIGAGAVAMAGLMTLMRTLPTIYASIRDSVRELRGRSCGRRPAAHRTRHSDHLGRLRLGRTGRADSARSADAGRLPVVAPRQPAHRRLRLLLRRRLVAHRRPDRLLVEPDLGHDDRDAARHVPHLRARGLGRRSGAAGRRTGRGAVGRRDRLHRGGERRAPRRRT